MTNDCRIRHNHRSSAESRRKLRKLPRRVAPCNDGSSQSGACNDDPVLSSSGPPTFLGCGQSLPKPLDAKKAKLPGDQSIFTSLMRTMLCAQDPTGFFLSGNRGGRARLDSLHKKRLQANSMPAACGLQPDSADQPADAVQVARRIFTGITLPFRVTVEEKHVAAAGHVAEVVTFTDLVPHHW